MDSTLNTEIRCNYGGDSHAYQMSDDSSLFEYPLFHSSQKVAAKPEFRAQIHTEAMSDLSPLLQMKGLQNYSLSNSVSICDHNGGILTSKDGNIRLNIPEGAIKDGDLVVFYFVICLYGPFILPSHCQADLASPYYWIGVTRSYHFQKPIEVEFEHYAVVTACDP